MALKPKRSRRRSSRWYRCPASAPKVGGRTTSSSGTPNSTSLPRQLREYSPLGGKRGTGAFQLPCAEIGCRRNTALELRIEPGRQLRRRFDGTIRSPDTASVLGSTEREVEYFSKLRSRPLQAQPPLEEPGKMHSCWQAGWTSFTPITYSIIQYIFTCVLSLSTHLHPRIPDRCGLLCLGSLCFHLSVAQVFGSWILGSTERMVECFSKLRPLPLQAQPPLEEPGKMHSCWQAGWTSFTRLLTYSHPSSVYLLTSIPRSRTGADSSAVAPSASTSA